eukprot:jgi/Mesvir1/24263/Mv10964-RA.1
MRLRTAFVGSVVSSLLLFSVSHIVFLALRQGHGGLDFVTGQGLAEAEGQEKSTLSEHGYEPLASKPPTTSGAGPPSDPPSTRSDESAARRWQLNRKGQPGPSVAICLIGPIASLNDTAHNMHRYLVDPFHGDVFVHATGDLSFAGRTGHDLSRELSRLGLGRVMSVVVDTKQPQPQKLPDRFPHARCFCGKNEPPAFVCGGGPDTSIRPFGLWEPWLQKKGCVELIQNHERTTRGGRPYDWVVFSRTEAMWWHPFPEDVLEQVAASHASQGAAPVDLYLPAAESWYGLNDRFAFATSRAAALAYAGLYDSSYAAFQRGLVAFPWWPQGPFNGNMVLKAYVGHSRLEVGRLELPMYHSRAAKDGGKPIFGTEVVGCCMALRADDPGKGDVMGRCCSEELSTTAENAPCALLSDSMTVFYSRATEPRWKPDVCTCE